MGSRGISSGERQSNGKRHYRGLSMGLGDSPPTGRSSAERLGKTKSIYNRGKVEKPMDPILKPNKFVKL